MSISSVGTSAYSTYAYNWSSKGLQEAVANPQSQTAASEMSYNGSSTVSSMAELAKYAMESMGLSENDRVTFGQIEKYKTQLEQEFSDKLNEKIAQSNIDAQASFTVTLSAEGKITVGGTHEDKAAIQAYFDATPSVGEGLLKDISSLFPQDDAESSLQSYQFTVQSDGTIIVPSSATPKDTTALEASLKEDLAETTANKDLQNVLSTAGFDSAVPLHFTMIDGKISIADDHVSKEELDKLLEDNPDIAKALQETLEAQDLEEGSQVTFSLESMEATSLSFTIAIPEYTMSSEDATKLQAHFNEENVGKDIKQGFTSIGIDPNIEFSLSIKDGAIMVNSSHPDAAKLQALINADEDLSKTYLQVDALAGLDGARKSMQIDVDAMRKRIQMESMTAWWDQMGQSSVGVFSSGNLSTFTGVNSTV